MSWLVIFRVEQFRHLEPQRKWKQWDGDHFVYLWIGRIENRLTKCSHSRLYNLACMMAARPFVSHFIFMSILFQYYKQLIQLTAKKNKLAPGKVENTWDQTKLVPCINGFLIKFVWFDPLFYPAWRVYPWCMIARSTKLFINSTSVSPFLSASSMFDYLCYHRS